MVKSDFFFPINLCISKEVHWQRISTVKKNKQKERWDKEKCIASKMTNWEEICPREV